LTCSSAVPPCPLVSVIRSSSSAIFYLFLFVSSWWARRCSPVVGDLAGGEIPAVGAAVAAGDRRVGSGWLGDPAGNASALIWGQWTGCA
jgi:hypothetical protein